MSKLSELVAQSRAVLGNLVASAFKLEVDGAEKKAFVLQSFGAFYDSVIAEAPIPYVPKVISRKLFAYLRPVAMELASSVIEDVYQLLLPKVVK